MRIPALIFTALLCWPAAACNARSNGKGTVIRNAGDLPGYTGKKITAIGKKSDLPWQHLIDPPETHPDIVYFDMGEIQIVVYSDKLIDCRGELAVTGTVVELEGTSKRPGSKEIGTEYHIIAEKWKCGD
ncbi:MAG: hypothetical protein ABIJ56_02625 [Pseudomonadota bacterium]